MPNRNKRQKQHSVFSSKTRLIRGFALTKSISSRPLTAKPFIPYGQADLRAVYPEGSRWSIALALWIYRS